jgi:hypothetical protein
MFLVPQKHIPIAMSMNTYNPMLGVRVARVPSRVLWMLLDQEAIPGYEFPHMRMIHTLVMLIPFLHIIAVLATFRRIRYWRTNHAQRNKGNERSLIACGYKFCRRIYATEKHSFRTVSTKNGW